MTIHEFDSHRSPGPPRRSGEPWTDDDYETLLHLCRVGEDLTTMSQRLGRNPGPVRERAKRLLPLDQRGVPGDRVLIQLRKNLLQDPDYDWAHHLAATPPPRPIINRVLPAPRYAGIPGLEDDELLATAHAMAQQRRPGASDDYLAQALAHEVAQRGLSEELHRAATIYTRAQVGDFLEQAAYPYHPTDCWAMAAPDETGWYETGWH